MKYDVNTRIFYQNEYKEELKYWQEIMTADTIPTNLPFDLKIQKGQERVIQTLEATVEDKIAQKIVSLCKKSDLSLYAFLLTAFQVLLFCLGRNDDVLIVSPTINKSLEDDDLSKQNRMYHKAKVDTETSFKELLLKTSNNIVNGNKNKHYPMDLILESVGIEQEEASTFDGIAFAMTNVHDILSLLALKFHLFLQAMRTEETSLKLSIMYNEALLDRKMTKDFICRYMMVLEEAVSNINIKVKDIKLVTKSQQQEILFHFNDTKSEFPRMDSICQRFEMQALIHPEKIALTYEESSISYGELNARANQLAQVLLDHKVVQGDIIGIFMETSIDFIISILAVMKVGAAYLPMSISYPEERILTMLNDCKVALLISKNLEMNKISYTKVQNFDLNETKMIVTKPRQQILDLDRVQMIDRSLVDYEKYKPFIGQAMVKNSVAIQFSRGCMFHCAYCFKIWPNNYVIRTAENVFQEMKMYYDMGVRRFTFVDDLPNFNLQVSTKLYQMIIDSGMKVHIHYPNGIRGDILNKEYIDLMVRAGCVSMDLALETTSRRLQKLIQKNLNIDKLKENIEYIIEKYPHVILELQILHGIPTETKEEAFASLEFLKNIKWIHFPYVHILKIYPNTEMARIAMENGVSREEIEASANLGYHELPTTLPFPKSFTKQYQSAFINEYFLNKERLAHVLPYQMKVLTENELVQKYNSYLPIDITCFEDLLQYVGIKREDLDAEFLPEGYGEVKDFNRKLRQQFPPMIPKKDAFRVLLLDLTQYFSKESNIMYDVVEPPLGLMYLMTSIQRKFGTSVNGKIAKSRIDFNSYEELKQLLIEFKPDIIGIRCMNFYKDFFHKSISLMREWGITVPIMTGGPYATSSYYSLLKDTNIDLAMLGEGEETITEVIDAVMKCGGKLPEKEVLSEIDGLAFVDRESNMVSSTRNILLFDEMKNILAKKSSENISLQKNPDSNAYIIYTSGSTGKPKGVLVGQQNLINQILGLEQHLKITSSLNYILLASVTFDVSVMHIFLSLSTGGRLFLVSDFVKKNPLLLWDTIIKNKIDIVNAVPALMEVLVMAGTDLYDEKPSIKHLFVGGEAFSKTLLKKIRETIRVEHIYNIYGPTETTINATIHECGEEPESLIPIGKPVINYKAYILDKNYRIVPIGYAGDLYIAGAGVSKGYLNDEKLTEKKFVDNPFESGDRMYATGDLARWNDDGEIVFLGRADYQVKIRGFRIELGEIKERLLEHKAVKEALVIDREDKTGSKVLHAFIVKDHQQELEINDLKLYLSRKLPDYMVPTYFYELDDIPLTMNGKIDTKALPDFTNAIEESGEVNLKCADVIEEKLVKMWHEILGVNHIGVNDNFFDFGGHSLKAAVFVSRAKKDLNVEITLRQLFKMPTIKQLADYIRKLDQVEYYSIEPVKKQAYYLLSAGQRRLLTASKLDETGVNYNMPEAYRVKGNFDVSRFEDIIRQLINRHEALRTTIELVDEEYVQIIHEEVDFHIETMQITLSEVEDAIQKHIVKFQFDKAPMIRVVVMQLDSEDHILFFDMHHILSDGSSLNIFIKEFLVLYRGEALPEIKVQYKDFSEWQNQQLQTGKMKKQEEFWLKLLSKDLPKLNLPLDYKRNKLQNFAGERETFMIEQELSRQLNKIASKYEVTLFMVLMAIYNILLSSYAKQEDIIVGTPVMGRPVAEVENTIGLFINMIAIRNLPKPDLTFPEFLSEVKEASMEAFEHQDYPFDELVLKLGENTDTSRNPIFDAVLHVMNLDMAQLQLPGLDFTYYPMKMKQSKYDLMLNCMEQSNGIQCVFEYRTSLFRQDTIKRLSKDLIHIIEKVTCDETQKLENLLLREDIENTLEITKDESLEKELSDFESIIF